MDRWVNLRVVEVGICEVVDRGVEIVCFPEMWLFIGSDVDKVVGVEELDGPSVSAM